jgi:hypothetical protein
MAATSRSVPVPHEKDIREIIKNLIQCNDDIDEKVRSIFNLLKLPDRPSKKEYQSRERDLFRIFRESWIISLGPLLQYVYIYRRPAKGTEDWKWEKFREGLEAAKNKARLNVGENGRAEVDKENDEQINVSCSEFHCYCILHLH